MNKSSIKCHHYRTVQRYNAKPNFKWLNVIYIDWTVVSHVVDMWGGLWCCAGATCSLLLGFRCQMFLQNFSLPGCSPIAFVSAHHSSHGKYFLFFPPVCSVCWWPMVAVHRVVMDTPRTQLRLLMAPQSFKYCSPSSSIVDEGNN